MNWLEYVLAGVVASVVSSVILLSLRQRTNSVNGIKLDSLINLLSIMQQEVDSKFKSIHERIGVIEQRLMTIEKRLMGGGE